MKGLKNILLLLVLTMVVSTMSASATPQEIKLCQKDQNIGGSWAICDPLTQVGKAHGTFGYEANPTETSNMDFTAVVPAGLIEGTSYTLVYYRDTDPTHVAASTLPLIQLGTGLATAGGALTISNTYNGGDIPAVSDVNPRGKIWIIPTTDIVGGFPTWAHWSDYMYESDMYTLETDPAGGASTVLTRMGGITFDDGVVNTIGDVSCPTIELSGGSKTSVSGINPEYFTTTATLTPTPPVSPMFKWYIDNVLMVTDSPSGFVSTFDASPYNVNDGLVDITKTVRVDAYTLCTGINADVPAATANGIWTIEPQIKSIEVDVNSINFGAVYPGDSSDDQYATVTNTGNVGVTVGVSASNMVSGDNTITNDNVDITESSNDIAVDSDVTVAFVLNIPGTAVGGIYTGTVEFATS